MFKLKPLIILAILCFPVFNFAQETILRIGGLDITPNNYGTIMIGPHQNQDSSARFANYYLELNTWIAATKNGKNLLSDGDITKQKMEPDWYPSQKVHSDTNKSNEIKFVTVFRDDRTLKNHKPLGIEITQQLYYKKNRDWAIFKLILKNCSSTNLNNLFFGVKLDADVPNKENMPSHDDDMIGKAENLLYIYDYDQTEKKSNIIGLLPLRDNSTFNFNWWDINQDPISDLERNQLVQSNKQELPDDCSDYRIMIAQGPFILKAEQEMDLVFALIESKGLDNALKAKQEAAEYFQANLAPGLKKLQHFYEPQVAEKSTPAEFKLFQNFPNPFNPVTTIRYSIAEDSYVEITIYNIKGELINRLVDAQQNAGSHNIIWNGCDKKGVRVSSGIYYYQVKAGSFETTKKMVLFQ